MYHLTFIIGHFIANIYDANYLLITLQVWNYLSNQTFLTKFMDAKISWEQL